MNMQIHSLKEGKDVQKNVINSGTALVCLDIVR